MESKAERELAHARYFQSQVAELTGYDLVSRDPPEPDVAAIHGNSVIGIEITEVHGNPRLRMTEAEQEHALRGAERVWRERGLPAIGVAVQWRPTRMPEKYTREFPTLLVNLVASKIPVPDETVEISDAEAATILGSRSPVEHIFARLSDRGITEWGSARRWQASRPAGDFYQREIDRKKAKPAGYRAEYDARWLLLVHAGANPSSGFDVAPNIEHASFVSPFDQVFLMSLTPLSVRRLKIRHW